MQKNISISLETFSSHIELNPHDQELLQEARHATKLAYAPYSHFYVGAAARLKNNNIVVGSNQENASYGATICAERVLLATLSSIVPTDPVNTIAISYKTEHGANSTPLSPCGICRQSLLEYETQHNTKLRIIMSGQSGEVWILNSAECLLPLAFSGDSLNS